MGHGGRTHFSFFDILFKIVHRNIGPGITAKINQDIINPFDAIEMSSQVIVMLNLCCELLAGKTEFFCKFIRQLYPVCFWEGSLMCIKVACGSSKFCTEWNVNE